MEINISKMLQEKTFASHIIIHSIAHCLKDIYQIKRNDAEEAIADIEFKINGDDVDLTVFAEHWQKQVNRMIHEKAQELLDEQMGLIDDYLHDLRETIKDKIRIINPDYEDYHHD